jgi:lipid-A-disaccharide synthase
LDIHQEAGVSGEGGGAKPTVLFTAFETSGDGHAALVIEALKREAAGLRICAWGGPRMEAAGATLIERTAQEGAMGLEAVGRAFALRRCVKRIKRWARDERIVAHVAVDSPAANFPIGKSMRRSGAKIVHLVAPQLWAWGRWRIGKLRKLTNVVLCLLPFEEQWFTERRVPAKFIGHPSINRSVDVHALQEQMHGLPQGAPRVAIFPGSRGHEVRRNTRLLAEVYTELQGRHGGMRGVIVAANPQLAKIVRRKIGVFPTGLHMITGSADAVIAWCDLAIAVSGTITLDIALQRKAMIGLYKTGVLSWLGAKLVLRTPYRLLPNIIAEREVVPEFVPHIGGAAAIVKLATRYLQDSKYAAVQSEELHRVCLRFANHDPAREAARLIVRIIKEGSRPEA